MRRIRIGLGLAVLSAAALAISGCSQGQQAGTQEADVQAGAAATAGSPAAANPLAAAPAAFGQCASCHSVEPGRHGIGPSLAGAYGTKAGDIPGYAFSAALKASGLTWDDATLDKWLSGPMQMVPGTKMTYAGLSDPAKRAEVIAYLKTLK